MFSWYVLSVQSRSESAVIDSIKRSISVDGCDDIDEVATPHDFLSDEQKKESKRKKRSRVLSGYVLIKMRMNPKTYKLVSSHPKVIGFVGVKNEDGYPQPITGEEIEAIVGVVKGDSSSKKSEEGVSQVFSVGDPVRVIDGRYSPFVGVVEAVDETNNSVKVAIHIFGRTIPVDLHAKQISHIN